MLKRKAIIESLPKHRFEEVLKDAGFRASKYLHKSDSGLSGTVIERMHEDKAGSNIDKQVKSIS